MALKLIVGTLVGTKMTEAGSIYWTGERFLYAPKDKKLFVMALMVPVWGINKDRQPVSWLKGLGDILNHSSHYAASEVIEIPDSDLPWNFQQGRVPETRPGQGRFRETGDEG
jgi:hypothetical protein